MQFYTLNIYSLVFIIFYFSKHFFKSYWSIEKIVKPNLLLLFIYIT